jgi:hypothetical protein
LGRLALPQESIRHEAEGIVPQSSELIKQVLELLELHREIFGQHRVYVRVLLLVVGEIFAFKGHRVSDILRGLRLVEEDWTAWYRLYQRRFNEGLAGAILLRQTLRHVGAEELYVIGVDCTQVPRDSHKMEGTSWQKNPRNPPWRISIHRGQRFLNGSWLTPLSAGFSRAIPLRWLTAFSEKAVLKRHVATKEQVAGVQFIQWVVAQLRAAGRANQHVLCLADGSYDHLDFWRGLPSGVTALVRTAKNRALWHLPPPYPGKGRHVIYGARALAPQDYLSQRQGWLTTTLTVRGRQRRTVYRVEGPFVRRTLTECPFFLICLRGQSWQRGTKKKQREPVFYLVNACHSDGQWQLPLPIQTLLTWAWQRWELEVVHREVKSLFGLGDKQCHHPIAAVASVQWSAWLYGLLCLAAYRTFHLPSPPAHSPAWYPQPRRWSLSSLLDCLRADLWADPQFHALLSASPASWPKLEAILSDVARQPRSRLEPAA